MSNLTEAASGNGTGSGRYAIVGYGFRMPGGIYTAGDFWQLLSRRGFIREPVAARYGPGYEPVLEDPGPSRFAGGYEGLMRGDEPYMFDARLFGISTGEASVMDPQIRMLLTCTWEALEQAGWDHAGLRNSRTAAVLRRRPGRQRDRRGDGGYPPGCARGGILPARGLLRRVVLHAALPRPRVRALAGRPGQRLRLRRAPAHHAAPQLAARHPAGRRPAAVAAEDAVPTRRA